MIEIVIASAAVGGVIITGIFQVVAFRRNGTHQAARDIDHAKKQAARDAVLASNQKAILGRLDDKDYGLQAVYTKVTTLTERVTGHDREIRDIKKAWSDSVMYIKGIKEPKT